MKSTKHFGVTVSLSSVGTSMMNPNLGDELRAGFLAVLAKALVTGTVEVMRMKKEDRVAEMHCVLIFDLSQKIVRDMNCDLF